MALKPPAEYAPDVRATLHWLVEDRWPDHSEQATGETQYLLCHARRLHESLTRLPAADPAGGRALVVGSWGMEVPYLAGRLGWRDIVCVSAPGSVCGEGDGQRPVTTIGNRAERRHPNGTETFAFTLVEHDIESGPLPFDDASFDLVVFWGCFEHLRHDPEFALYEINRVCRAGGTVSLVTDNAISFQATHAMLRGEPMPMRLHWPASEGHWRLYSPTEIDELLRGTGWRVDLLTTICPDPPVYWKPWKRRLFAWFVARYRRGFGLREPYWHAFVLAQAVKVAGPRRSYPRWLYKDEKIVQLRREMEVGHPVRSAGLAIEGRERTAQRAIEEQHSAT